MTALRNERTTAFLLIGAAVLGVLLANSPAAGALDAIKRFPLAIPALGLNLTVGQWTSDGLLAVFFFLAAIELKHELRHGELDSPHKALVPTVAAIGGVIAPALIYLAIVHTPTRVGGWPIPTATDIAFALGVLAIAGRGLPSRVRAMLLALAVIDDLIAIVIIAIFFTHGLHLLPLLMAVPVIGAFALLSRLRMRWWVILLLVVLGVAAWILVHDSGIHATIAGVALGLAMAGPAAAKARHAIEPFDNLIVLPLFAFFAALVALPRAGTIGPVFWAVLIALPVGKLIGITAGAMIAAVASRQPKSDRIPLGDIVAVAGLGGIGFTVSLLMNELAFARMPDIATQGTLGVLAASVVSTVIGVVLVRLRVRRARAT